MNCKHEWLFSKEVSKCESEEKYKENLEEQIKILCKPLKACGHKPSFWWNTCTPTCSLNNTMSWEADKIMLEFLKEKANIEGRRYVCSKCNEVKEVY